MKSHGIGNTVSRCLQRPLRRSYVDKTAEAWVRSTTSHRCVSTVRFPKCQASVPMMSSFSSYHFNPYLTASFSTKTPESSDKQEQGTAEPEDVSAADAEQMANPNESKHPESSLDGDREMYTTPITIRMPDMSEEDDLHNVVETWFKEPGDIVKHNDVLCDIATPDFTFGMVTDDEEDAIMGELLVDEGEEVPDNAPICILYHKTAPTET